MESDSRGVLDLIHAGEAAAAVGAGLELGLFWLLDERPRQSDEVARELGVPGRRAAYWLEILERTGLLECARGGYRPSAWARTAILDTYSEETWAFLALEAREAQAARTDLPARLRSRGDGGSRVPGYVELMTEDSGRAKRFTRMLAELHAQLAADIAACVPLDDVGALLDLGGGSGVVAMALARRFPTMTIAVVDIPNVCAAGREMVAGHGLDQRIAFVPRDLGSDDLPAGFDAAIECDVGLYSVSFFERVRSALRPGGRFVIVDELAFDDAAPTVHLDWAFARSLDDPGFVPPTVASVVSMLKSAGFGHVTHDRLADSGSAGGDGRDGGDAFASAMSVVVAGS